MVDRTVLVEQVGNLLEMKMNALLKERGIVLFKNPDVTSQQYFFLKDSKSKPLEEILLSEIYKMFNENFYSYGLGVALDTYCMYFGIAHLSTNELEKVINYLETK